MHDVLGVHEVESEEHLLNNASGTLLSEAVTLLGNDLFHEMATTHELSDDVVIAGILHQVKDTSNVWVLGLFKHLKLIFVKLFVDLMFTQLLLADNLHSTRHLGALVLTDLNFAKRASSQLTAKLIVLTEVLHALKLHLLFEAQKVGCTL